jgi:putative hydrolase of the HAD superfamily
MIGDSWEADVMGALDYGIQAIYFNPERSIANKSVVEISKLIELKSIL